MATLTINDILNDIRLKATNEKEKGTDFERLMKLWFLTDPRYNFLEKVWLWEEFPARKDFGGKDLGIDLVARDEQGDYYAIQAKCYAENAAIDKSAIEWIVERYAVTIDKKSLIKNDANDWAKEHHKPRYILDLLLSVINVSIQTVDIVNSLPKLKFD